MTRVNKRLINTAFFISISLGILNLFGKVPNNAFIALYVSITLFFLINEIYDIHAKSILKHYLIQEMKLALSGYSALLEVTPTNKSDRLLSILFLSYSEYSRATSFSKAAKDELFEEKKNDTIVAWTKMEVYNKESLEDFETQALRLHHLRESIRGLDNFEEFDKEIVSKVLESA